MTSPNVPTPPSAPTSQPIPPPYYAMPPPAAPQKSRVTLFAAVVVAIVVIVAVLAVVTLYHSGRLNISVTNVSIISTISLTVSVDGVVIYASSVSPLSVTQLSQSPSWWGGSCMDHTVAASGTGGLLGPTSDSKTVALCGGQTLAVALTI